MLLDHLNTSKFSDTLIPVEFSPYVNNQVQHLLNTGGVDEGKNRREVEGITIDAPTSPDLDDAVYAERIQNGYCLFVHIADPTAFIPAFSPIDLEACRRGYSIYRKDESIPMVPPELSHNRFSLVESEERKPTFTFQIDLDLYGKVTTFEIYESSFKSLKRYDYAELGEDMKHPENDNYDVLHLIQEITSKLSLQQQLYTGKIISSDEPISLRIGTMEEEDLKTVGGKLGNSTIGKIARIVNTLSGQFLAEHSPDLGLFKTQEVPGERTTIHHRAGKMHVGVGSPNYVNVTSPLRRYQDNFLHRVLRAILHGLPQKYTSADTVYLGRHLNNRRYVTEVLGRLLTEYPIENGHMTVDTPQEDHKARGERHYEKICKNMNGPVKGHHVKDHIKTSMKRRLGMSKSVKQAVIEDILNRPIGDWSWMIGVILLGVDNDVKKVLRDKIVRGEAMLPKSVLSSLSKTQIIDGKQFFDTRETLDSHCVKIEVFLYRKCIATGEAQYEDEYHKSLAIGAAKKKAVSAVFAYFTGE